MLRFLKNKIISSILIPLVIAIIFWPIVSFDIFQNWNEKAKNYLYREEEIDPQVVIIAIDEKSLNDNTGLGRWPWRRNYHADLINILEKNGAKVIALDIIFDTKSQGIYSKEDNDKLINSAFESDNPQKYFIKESSKYFPLSLDPSANHPDDQYLVDTINKYNNIILATTSGKIIKSSNEQIKYISPIKSIIDLRNDNKWGVIAVLRKSEQNIDAEKEGVNFVSQIPVNFLDAIKKQKLEVFSIQAIQKYLNIKESKQVGNFYYLDDKIKIPLSQNNLFNINFRQKSYSFPMISYVDALQGNFIDQDKKDDRNYGEKFSLKDKIVLVGATASLVFHDEALTPISRISDQPLMPGVEIHANAIQTILDQKFLIDQSTRFQIITIAGLALISAIILNYCGILISAIYIILAFISYTFAAKFAFDQGIIFHMVNPYLALLFTYILSLTYRYFTETRDKLAIEGAFSHFVNEEVVKEISKNPDQVTLSGEKRIMTVFFSDIANFTTVSEKMEAYHLVRFLNEYLDAMTKVILKNRGTLDKYEGDAIMAFWGAPIKNPNHAYYACLAALECRQILTTLHQHWQKEGLPLLDFRIGINTGEMIVGNMGSTEHFSYTVIGDAVNLGSRLEQANKEFGTKIMVSENTYQSVKDYFEFRSLGMIKVKGKEQAVGVWELINVKKPYSPPPP